jgi:hypothetical protein
MTQNSHFFIRQFFSAGNLFLFGVAFFIRFPFFFRDFIDRDESTFILIGNSITDGYLPYDFLWDLKPPLLFYVLGLVEYIFPHSLIAIRLFGVIIVFLSAIFLIQIVKSTGAKNGFVIALSYILLSSSFDSIQGVMSEHVAVFFFLPGLLLFLKSKSPLHLLFAGFFFGCALLSKLNYAYAVLALLLYYFIAYYKPVGFKSVFKHAAFVISGLLISILLISTPYMLRHKLSLFIDSVFMASLEYGHTTQVSALHKLNVSWWIIATGLFISILAIKLAGKEFKKTAGLFAAVLMGTIFTFYSSGTVNGHYLIQVYPFMIILFFAFILNREFKPGYLTCTLLVLALCIESYKEYYRIIRQYSKNSTFYNGKSFIAINELKKRQLENKKIFFADYHIGYWFLHTYPLTKSTTHPSSLSRPAFFKHFGNNRTSLEELTYIMEEIKPEVIVSRRGNLSFFEETSPENLYFLSRMKIYFNLIYQDPKERIYIWQQKEN